MLLNEYLSQPELSKATKHPYAGPTTTSVLLHREQTRGQGIKNTNEGEDIVVNVAGNVVTLAKTGRVHLSHIRLQK